MASSVVLDFNVRFESREEEGKLHLFIVEGQDATLDKYIEEALRLASEREVVVFWVFKGIELNTGMAKHLKDFASIVFSKSLNAWLKGGTKGGLS